MVWSRYAVGHRLALALVQLKAGFALIHTRLQPGAAGLETRILFNRFNGFPQRIANWAADTEREKPLKRFGESQMPPCPPG
jgi:hypothetical protein